TNCWDNYQFNTTSCAWENLGSPYQYYVDTDEDGFGSKTIAFLCDTSAPTGYSVNNSDCNDNDANINPSETEISGNGTDDDCNPATPDGSLEIDNFNLETILISPNPFNSKITIKVPLSFYNTEFGVKVFDLNGRLVHDNKYLSANGTIHVSNLDKLEQAPYLLEIISNKTGNTVRRRLVKY
ncbi:T9SS type A sorting domain-containing protein, partial [Mariniflexile soesokkakense]